MAEEPLLQGSQEGKDLLIEAMKYHLLPEQRNNMVSIRTTHRKPEGLRPYLFAIGKNAMHVNVFLQYGLSQLFLNCRPQHLFRGVEGTAKVLQSFEKFPSILEFVRTHV